MTPLEATIFRHGLKHYVNQEKAMAQIRQVNRKRSEYMKEARQVDGLGQLIGVIDARIYFRWMQEDPDFWNDKKNVDKFMKDNPEYAMPTKRTK